MKEAVWQPRVVELICDYCGHVLELFENGETWVDEAHLDTPVRDFDGTIFTYRERGWIACANHECEQQNLIPEEVLKMFPKLEAE